MHRASQETSDGRRITSKRRRPSTFRHCWCRSRNAFFQVIVAIEIVFLVVMWTTIPSRIQSLTLRSHRNAPESISKRFIDQNHKKRRRQQEDTWNRRDDSSSSRAHLYHLQHRFRHNVDTNYIPTQHTLIIGGSDGSGTRAIAATMRKLGVNMKLDSRETLDTLAPPRSGGWANLVNMVLNHTHSLDYEVGDLPQNVQKELNFHMKRFWGNVKRFRHADRTSIQTGVFAGVKAPATMVLLPFLTHVIGNVKYLHVVRDGRDIALSKNQSPVLKFYQTMYTDADERQQHYSNGSEPVLAMHLWNDWNTQSLRWQQAHANATTKFEYMVIRSEDMVNPKTKLATLKRMAAFVESSVSGHDLCAMARSDAIDLGKSISWNLDNETATDEENVKREAAEDVKKRYGKWKQFLENRQELSSTLHHEGAMGLAAFGYKPRLSVLNLGTALSKDGIDTTEC